MTLEDVKALVLSADEQAMHYVHAKGRSAYTTWRETRGLNLMANNEHERGWAFTIDRFTQTEFDGVAKSIAQILTEAEGVAYSYLVDYERDSGYIHHIFDCEGI